MGILILSGDNKSIVDDIIDKLITEGLYEDIHEWTVIETQDDQLVL